MEKNERLKEKTEVLILLLVKYGKNDPEVMRIYERMRPLFEAIKNGEIVPPQRDTFSRYFFDVESREPWFIKYPDLTAAEAEYAAVLRGWRS